MDSITQAALGATVAGISAGKQTSKKVLLWGAVAGTLPDLDIIHSFFTDDVSRLVSHRGVTHSFIVVPFAAYLFSRLFVWLAPRTALSAKQWFWLFFWCFTTHIILDLVTVYGTQIFYPFTRYPYALSSLFIIDPFYTIPLIGGLAYFALSKTPAGHRRRVLISIAALTSLYIMTAIVFKTYASHRFEAALDRQEINYRQFNTLNSPFNILVWRAVVMTEDANLNAWYSILSPNKPIVFNQTVAYSEREKLNAFATPGSDLARLISFSKGFYRYEEDTEGIRWVDLRFAAGGRHPFRYLVAVRNDEGELQPLTTATRLPMGERPPMKVIFDELYEHI